MVVCLVSPPKKRGGRWAEKRRERGPGLPPPPLCPAPPLKRLVCLVSPPKKSGEEGGTRRDEGRGGTERERGRERE